MRPSGVWLDVQRVGLSSRALLRNCVHAVASAVIAAWRFS